MIYLWCVASSIIYYVCLDHNMLNARFFTMLGFTCTVWQLRVSRVSCAALQNGRNRKWSARKRKWGRNRWDSMGLFFTLLIYEVLIITVDVVDSWRHYRRWIRLAVAWRRPHFIMAPINVITEPFSILAPWPFSFDNYFSFGKS